MTTMPMVDTAMLRAVLAVSVQAGLPLMIWGDPGSGKSTIVEEVAMGLGRRLEVLIGSTMEPTDLGVPVVRGDFVELLPLRWALALNEAERAMLFLDELTNTPPASQTGLLDVVYRRRVGQVQLHDGVSVVAAANPPESATDGYELAAPMWSRMAHVDFEPDFSAWAAHVSEDADPDPTSLPVLPVEWRSQRRAWVALVTRALSAHRSAWDDVPERPTGPFPCPRTWDQAIAAAAAVSAAGLSISYVWIVMSAWVGEGAMRVVQAAHATQRIPDPDRLLDGSVDVRVHDLAADELLMLGAELDRAVRAVPTLERWRRAVELLAGWADNRLDLVAHVLAPMLIPDGEPRSNGVRQLEWDLPECVGVLAPLAGVLAQQRAGTKG